MQLRRVMILSISLLMGVLIACRSHAPEPPPPAAKDRPAAKAQMKDGWGEARFNSLPWANMVIDGKPRGRTGTVVKLPAGVHNVVLMTSDGRIHKMVLTVENQKVVTVCWNFDLKQPCKR